MSCTRRNRAPGGIRNLGNLKKILVIRFSSIGDVVLTSPVVRAVREQLGAEVHFLTRLPFLPLVAHNPHITKVHTFQDSLSEVIPSLRHERFDLVIDLHKNLRSFRIRSALRVKTLSFDKLNVRKLLAVRLKARRLLPDKHIVRRYFEGVAAAGISDDGRGLEYYLGAEDYVDVESLFFKGAKKPFIVLVVGGSYYTKKIPFNKLVQICDRAKLPVVLMGDKGDRDVAEQLRKLFPHLISGCGQFTIGQSASIVSQAEWVITSDTGLMHIAAAFSRKIISAWGNTIPEFGMYPYHPRPENRILEITYLSCRPCSKLGYKRCPRGHFRCMQDIDYEFVQDLQ